MLLKILHIHITWVIFQQFIRRNLKPVAFIVNIVSFFHIRISTKRQAFHFFQRNCYTNVCLKFLYDAKLMTPLLILTISSKNLKWKQHFHNVTRGFELVTCRFELVTRGFELVTRGFELVTRGFELVTRGFELSLLNFKSCF